MSHFTQEPVIPYNIVVTVSGHHTKRGWAERAWQRLCEQIQPLGVELNMEKTKVVDMLDGDTFGFLEFDFRRILNREKNRYYILLTPKKKARLSIKWKIREIIKNGGATPAKELISRINTALAGWVGYFRVGNSSRAFSEVRDYLEMKVRILLTRRKRRQKRSVFPLLASKLVILWSLRFPAPEFVHQSR